jgi:hypothetical protein
VRQIVLAGFSFMDKPLNRTIAAYRRPESQIVIINPDERIEQIARQELKLRKNEAVVMVPEPLPGGLSGLG